MSQPIYETLVFVKDGKRVGKTPYANEIPDTLIWGDALWRADGSIGNFEYRYTFERNMPRVAVDDPDA